MNNKKLLSVAILLALAKSALGIEVEPNNDSSKANPLGTENVGKLNRASDVDFFKIDSCIKDNAKKCTNKRREEVSISFTCSNKSSASPSGWFLGIHDSNGELQETYPVKPDDCIISDKTSGAFNFKFSSLDSPNYYVSVVADCQVPIYNTVTDPKDPTKTIVNVNKFVSAALAKQADIDAARAEVIAAQKAIDAAKTDLSTASFSVINSNVNIKNLANALNLSSDILLTASSTLTPASNVSAAFSNAKAIQIAAYAMQYSIFTFGQFLTADAAANNPAVQAAIDAADIAVTNATAALKKAQDDKTADDKKVSDSQAANQAAYDKDMAAYDKEVAANQADYDKDQAAYDKEVAANQAVYDKAVITAQAVFDKADTDYNKALTLLTTNNSQETKDLVSITQGFRTNAQNAQTKISTDGVAKVRTTKPIKKVATKPTKSISEVLKADANVKAALATAITDKEKAENTKKTAENLKVTIAKNL
ncbi:MAG: hypothetical protein QX194_04775, partial [Methylococcales bacterium]